MRTRMRKWRSPPPRCHAPALCATPPKGTPPSRCPRAPPFHVSTERGHTRPPVSVRAVRAPSFVGWCENGVRTPHLPPLLRAPPPLLRPLSPLPRAPPLCTRALLPACRERERGGTRAPRSRPCAQAGNADRVRKRCSRAPPLPGCRAVTASCAPPSPGLPASPPFPACHVHRTGAHKRPHVTRQVRKPGRVRARTGGAWAPPPSRPPLRGTEGLGGVQTERGAHDRGPRKRMGAHAGMGRAPPLCTPIPLSHAKATRERWVARHPGSGAPGPLLPRFARRSDTQTRGRVEGEGYAPLTLLRPAPVCIQRGRAQPAPPRVCAGTASRGWGRAPKSEAAPPPIRIARRATRKPGGRKLGRALPGGCAQGRHVNGRPRGHGSGPLPSPVCAPRG